MREIQKLIENYKGTGKAKDWVKENKGLSGADTADILAKCSAELEPETECYLEVGIFQGVNLAYVASKTDALCCGVDNFSNNYKEESMYNKHTREVVQEKLKEKSADKNTIVFEQDYKDFFKDRENINGKKVKIYYYDGSHEYEDQVNGIELAFPLLADEAFIFIDDFAAKNVRNSIEYLKDNKHLKYLKKLSGGDFMYGVAVLKFER